MLKIDKNNLFLPALLVLLLVLNILGYYMVPKHEKSQVVQPVTELVMESRFDYEILASIDTILWSSGEILQPGMPLYFYALEPSLFIYPNLQVKEPSAGTIDMEITLVNLGRDKEVYWSKPLTSRQIDVDLNDEEALEPIKLDVMDILEIEGEITQELNFRGGKRYVLITMQGNVGEESIKHNISFLLDSNGIIPPPDNKLTVTKETIEERAEKVMESRTLYDYLGCWYFWSYISALVILAVTALFMFKSEKKGDYQKYDKWVSKAGLALKKDPDAYFDSLKELIEMSVELDKKVIYDSSREAYYILDGDNLYVHLKQLDKSSNADADKQGDSGFSL